MSRKGDATCEKILDAAEALIFENGFAGTSIDEVLARTGLTKGAFFYHFKSKGELAHALIRRFAEQDATRTQELLRRGEELSDDPLQQLLITFKLYEETFATLEEPLPGCLYASYCYETGQFDAAITQVCCNALAGERRTFSERFRRVLEKYPPRMEVSAEELADTFTCIVEGAIIVSKSLKEPKLIAVQVRQYRNYLRLLFSDSI